MPNGIYAVLDPKQPLKLIDMPPVDHILSYARTENDAGRTYHCNSTAQTISANCFGEIDTHVGGLGVIKNQS